MSNPTPASDPVGKILVKHGRKTNPSTTPSTPEINSPLSTRVKPVASVEDCVELCKLLLEKVGADSERNDSAQLEKVLLSEYPPGVAQILGKITGTLDTDGILDSVSDVTDSSDDESIPIPEKFEIKKPLPSPSLPVTPEYKADTEISVSRIFQLGKFSSVQDPSIPPSAPYYGKSVITMTGFGELGRFGNQVLQYAFLKSYATLHNVEEIQVPKWVGANLFDLHDKTVARAFPSVVEYSGTLANSTFTDDLLNYVKKANGDCSTIELNGDILNPNSAIEAPKNVDIWGWFQWHSSFYEPFKNILRDTFSPSPYLKDHLQDAFNRNIRYKDGVKRTVIGVHLRYGDYQNIAASSFGYCAPTSWYLEWLEKIWPTVENPILVVTSDDLKAVSADFSSYDMVTTNSAGMDMPRDFKGLKAGFFPDWYALTQCDILAISNSTFSFSASLMNSRKNLRVFRAHYAHKMIEISPWNADPIVHRDVQMNGFSKALETFKILYSTQGMSAVVRNLVYELPSYGIRALIMKGVLWKSAKGKSSGIA